MLAALATADLMITARAAGAATPEVASRDFPVGDFTEIELHIPADVEIALAGRPQVTVQAEPKVLDRLRISVRDRRLIVASESFKSQAGVKVRITSPRIQSLSIDSAADVKATGLRGERFVLHANASSNTTLNDIQTDQLSVTLEGSDSVKASGKVRSLRIAIGGSSSLDAGALQAQQVEGKVSGSSDALIAASRLIDATVTESSTLKYRGAAEVKTRVSDAAEAVKVQ